MQVVEGIIEKLLGHRRKLATAGVGVFAVYLAFHVIFGANGMVQYHRKRAEFKNLQVEVDQMQAENDRLEKQIKSLKSDPKTIEKEAREQLKYARPGEVVYVIPAPKPEVPAVAAAQKK